VLTLGEGTLRGASEPARAEVLPFRGRIPQAAPVR
jgi:hypothetical protein